jgi:hypothetical protein
MLDPPNSFRRSLQLWRLVPSALLLSCYEREIQQAQAVGIEVLY